MNLFFFFLSKNDAFFKNYENLKIALKNET